jgi:hypothetical protein
MLRNRVALGTMVMAAAMLAGQGVYAEVPASTPTLTRAAYGKAKMVKFNLRNDSKAPLKLQVNGQEMTLAPGQLTSVKLAVGDKIVAENAGPGYAAGDVLQVVADGLNDSTVVLQ